MAVKLFPRNRKEIQEMRDRLNAPVRSQRGMALVLAVFTVVLITYLVVELTYETNIEYIVNSNSVNRLKAYYAARSGLELSLLRVKLYTKVQRQLGAQMGSQSKLLDLIWNFPFAWPIAVPAEINEADRGLINDAVSESLQDATYSTSIRDEGSRIDLNDLASESKKIAEITYKNMLNIFEGQMQDEAFRKAHPNFRAEELIEDIKDWVDADSESKFRGRESEIYQKLNVDGLVLPPNRAFRTIEELRFIPSVDDDIFRILKDRVTVYGMKAINPNHANKETLMSLDISITSEVADEIIKRRSDDDLGGPFKDGQDHCKGDFWGFVNGKGGRVERAVVEDLPLKCDSVANFRITAVGEFAGVTREIEAVVYDVKMSAQAIADAVKKERQEAQGGAPAPTQPAPGTSATRPQQEPLPKGPPRIVYYNER